MSQPLEKTTKSPAFGPVMESPVIVTLALPVLKIEPFSGLSELPTFTDPKFMLEGDRSIEAVGA